MRRRGGRIGEEFLGEEVVEDEVDGVVILVEIRFCGFLGLEVAVWDFISFFEFLLVFNGF